MSADPFDKTILLAQLEDQVAAALELPDRARALAFEKLRDAHPEHTALLERCERAAASLEPELRSVDSVSAAVRKATLAEAPAEIGAYKVLDVLGEGGMGIVYFAEQQQPVRRRVALKVIKEGAGKDVLARFELERQSLAMMSHPNIAKVLDAGVGADGRPFFAMEHVPGIAITEFCDRQRLDLRARIELFQKVCHGVQHAHQKGVIHRDLKPSNILVTHRDGYVEPKIIDFGVAKALQQRLTEQTLYTEQGRILGTPEYMSPEQAEMSVLDVDTRSDIYSLGVLLYNLLAGRLPIDGKELRQAGYFEMQRRIREDEPQRPSTRLSTVDADARTVLAERRRTDLRQLLVALRGDLDWIVMRCLEKDPARRYQSASELAADLQRHLVDEPVLAGPPTVGYRLKKLVRRHRVPIAAAVAVLLALITGLSIAIWQYGIASDNAVEAKSAAEEAQRQTEQAAENLRVSRANEQRAVDAERQTAAALQKSRALNLAAASMRALERDPLDALLLALAAVDRVENPETLGRLQAALAENFLVGRLPDASAPIRATDYDATTGSILQGCDDGALRVLDQEGKEQLALTTTGEVLSARFSTDGQRLLVVSVLGERHVVARAFDRDGKRLAEWQGDGEQLNSVDWSPDGLRLVGRHADSGRIVLRGVDGQSLGELAAESPMRTGVGFAPDGRAIALSRQWLAVWSADGGDVARMQTEDDEPKFSIPGIRKANGRLWRNTTWLSPGTVAFDPTGELVAVRSGPIATVWSRSGQRLTELRGHLSSIRTVAFSPSGSLLATAGNDGTARVWSLDGEQVAILHAGAQVLGAHFVDSDRRVLTWNPFSVALWSDEGRQLDEIRGFGTARVAQPLPGDQLLLVDGPRSSIWSLRGSIGSRFRGSYDRPSQIACAGNGDMFAGSKQGFVVGWTSVGAVRRVYDSGTGRPLAGVACSPDGSTVVAGGQGATLYAWDRHSGELLWQQQVDQARVLTHVFFIASGTRLIVGDSLMRWAFLVDVATRAVQRLPDSYFTVAASADGRFVAGGLLRGRGVEILDTSGRKLARFGGVDDPESWAWHMAFDRNGHRILLAGADGEISAWDVADVLAGKADLAPVYRARHRDRAYAIDFHPDGERFVAALGGTAYVAGLDGTEHMRVWPRAGRFVTYTPPVAIYSPDGEWLYGVAYDGLRRWPANAQKLVALAREVAERLGKDRALEEYADLLEPVSTPASGR